MSKLLDYLKAAGGEASLMTKLGFWRQAVSGTVDNLVDLVQLVTGGGLLPATGTSQGSRPLNGYVTALLQTGDEVFVQGINEIYYYDATSALAADGLNVVNAVGPGQFIRGSSVIVQADWYVDSVTGDDENTGSLGAPLRTLDELAKRWSGKVLLSSITSSNIRLTGTFPAQILSLGNVTIARGQALAVSGSMQTTATGTITTYTARNAAADASATVLADISFAGHFRSRMRLTSGANNGAYATVLADLGGNTCRIAAFVSPTTGSAVVPANGDTFVIETPLTILGGVTISNLGAGTVKVQDIELSAINSLQPTFITPAPSFNSGASYAQNTGLFQGCVIRSSGYVISGCFSGCTMASVLQLRTGNFFVNGGAFVTAVSGLSGMLATASATVQFGPGAYICFEGTTTQTVSINSFLSQQVDIQVFANTSTRFCLISDGSDWIYSSGWQIYGTGNAWTTNAFQVNSGCSLQYLTNKPRILGSNPGVNDVKLGGTDYGWGAMPLVNATNNAMVVVRA